MGRRAAAARALRGLRTARKRDGSEERGEDHPHDADTCNWLEKARGGRGPTARAYAGDAEEREVRSAGIQLELLEARPNARGWKNCLFERKCLTAGCAGLFMRRRLGRTSRAGKKRRRAWRAASLGSRGRRAGRVNPRTSVSAPCTRSASCRRQESTTSTRRPPAQAPLSSCSVCVALVAAWCVCTACARDRGAVAWPTKGAPSLVMERYILKRLETAPQA